MEVRPFDRLVDALELSRASGTPIEKFAGGMIDAEQPKENKYHACERSGEARSHRNRAKWTSD
jgi:hypothetical protein